MVAQEEVPEAKPSIPEAKPSIPEPKPVEVKRPAADVDEEEDDLKGWSN